MVAPFLCLARIVTGANWPNAFSKKVENHAHTLAIDFMHYNFACIHSTVRCSPAMAAKVTDKLMDL
jgi:hypothetical protein